MVVGAYPMSEPCFEDLEMYLARMERVARVVERDQVPSDKHFWRSRSAEERLTALEFLRTQYMAHIHAEQRLQRVCRIAQRARR